jgi:uncharacterized protein (TIGR02466 family)
MKVEQNFCIENWFAVPIYFCYVNEYKKNLLAEEIENKLDKLQDKDLENPWNDGVETSFKYGQNDFLQDSDMFIEIVSENCKNFCNNLNLEITEITISESWINLSHYDNYQHFHNHLPFINDISGVYYHQATGVGDDGIIEFKNPNIVAKSSFLLSNYSSDISYVPEPGKMILFPSFLDHCVYRNATDQTRISVSFNVQIQ